MSPEHYFFVTSLQYYCILGLAEIKTLHPRDKVMRKKAAGCAGNKITAALKNDHILNSKYLTCAIYV